MGALSAAQGTIFNLEIASTYNIADLLMESITGVTNLCLITATLMKMASQSSWISNAIRMALRIVA